MSSAAAVDNPAPIYPSKVLDQYAGLSIESISLSSDVGVLVGNNNRDQVIAANFSEIAFKSSGSAIDIRIINGKAAEALDLCSAAYLRMVIRNDSATLDTAITSAAQLIDNYAICVGGKTYYTVNGDHEMLDMRDLSQDKVRLIEQFAGYTHSDASPSAGPIEFLTGLCDYVNPTNGNPTLLLASSALTASDTIGNIIRIDDPAVVTSGFTKVSVPQCGNSGFIPRGGSIVYLLKLAPFPHWDRKVALNHINQDVIIRIKFKTGLSIFQDQVKQTFAGPVNASLHANYQDVTLAELQVIKVGQTLEGAAKEKLENRFKNYNVHCRTLSYGVQYNQILLPATATVQASTVFNSFQGLFKQLIFIVRPVPNGSSDERLQLVKSYNGSGQLTAIAPRSIFKMDDTELIITGNNSFFASGTDDDDVNRVIENLEAFNGAGSTMARSLYYASYNFSALSESDNVGSRLGGGVRIAKDFKFRFTLPNRAALAALGFTNVEVTCLAYQYSDVVVDTEGTCTQNDLTDF